MRTRTGPAPDGGEAASGPPRGHGLARRSFLTGALILLVGTLASRVLGGVYHFVLPALMGGGQRAAVGMGLFYGMAYQTYNVILSFTGVGVYLAVSKLVAEASATVQGPVVVRRVLRVALAALAVGGFVLAAVLWLLAGPIARVAFHDPRAALAIKAIAPAVFLAALAAVYRGFFQGLQHMAPHAASQVIEQTVRVLTMFALVLALIAGPITEVAAGASFGAVTGAAAALAFLLVVVRRDPRARAALCGTEAERAREPDPGPAWRTSAVLRRLLALVIPIALAGVVLPVTNLMDAVIVPLRLQFTPLAAESTALLGVLVGYALPFMMAPTVLTTALATSLLPAVSEAVARRDQASANSQVALGLRVTVLTMLPAAVGIFVLAGPLPLLLYHSSRAAAPLAVLAAATLFVGIQQSSTGALQGMGLPGVPVANLAWGAAVNLAISWWLIAVPGMNVTGAAVGMVTGFAVAATLNVRALSSRLGPVLDWGQALRALAAAAIMGVAARVALQAVAGHRLVFGVLAAVAVGVVVYALALATFGGLRAADVAAVPRFGAGLLRAMRRLRLVRD